jgi:methylmalonyl-CoA mutase N-terminal domain/subunit
MYRGRFWTMRQYAGFGSATETNQRFRYLLEQGQSGLSVAFDLPTQMGYDADHEVARSEVGKVGVAISSVEDMAALFDAIPLDRVSTSMTINSTASILLCLYMAVGERQGVSSDRLSGTVQNDILKEYIARGTYVYPPGPSMRLITDTFAFCRERVPRWNTISISGYHLREAGSTAAQEVAFTLANGIAYVTAAQEAGLKVDEFAPQLSFFFNAHNNLLEEVAKFRAARRLWARIMKDRFDARDPRSRMLRFHAQTAGSMLTAQQPENNIVRVAVQALAAVLGGCQSLHTNSMDEALSLPSEAAVRLALRTQQVLAHESGVADIVDPLGGSYSIERITKRIEEEAETYIAKIDGLGGSVHAIPFMQREIQEAAYRYQQDVEAKQRVVVGVNEFVMDEPPPANLFQVDASVGQALAERLAVIRRTRDASAAARALEAVDRVARGRDNLLPHILTAVRAQVTLGEICDTLRQVFGVHQPSVVF